MSNIAEKKPKKGKKCQCPKCSIGRKGMRRHICLIPDCQKVFRSPYKFNVHLEAHTEKKKHVCPYCHKKYSCHQSLHRHLKTHHKTNNQKKLHNRSQHICHIRECGKVFCSTFSLKRHLIGHSGIKKYFCAHCNKGFVRKDKMSDHFKTHVNVKQNVTSNDIERGPVLQSYFSLQPIKLPLSINKDKKLKNTKKQVLHCTAGCKKVYYSTTDLNTHVQLDHGVKPYVCTWPSCSKEFMDKHALRRHEETHVTEKNFVCAYCDKGFKTSQYLKNHFHRMHRNLESMMSI